MSFSVTGGSPAAGSVVGTNCATDWITIPCATNSMDPTAQTGTPATCVDRICGMVFNSVTAASTTSSTSVYSKSSFSFTFSFLTRFIIVYFCREYFITFMTDKKCNDITLALYLYWTQNLLKNNIFPLCKSANH